MMSRPGCYVCRRYAEAEYRWKDVYWCEQCLGYNLIEEAEGRGEVVHLDDEEDADNGSTGQG